MAVSSRARPTRRSRSPATSPRSSCSAVRGFSRTSCRAPIASISPRSTPRPRATRTSPRSIRKTGGGARRARPPPSPRPPSASPSCRPRRRGATLVAMEDVVAGRARVAFNGSGGLHHAMRRNASGFCIYNDPAIVCGLLADRGMKVAYVDIDAHHGDGVQAAFYDTAQVLTISLHEFGMIPRLGRPFFPGTGSADERGTGKGAGYSVNVALPAYTDDLAYMRAFDAVVPPLLDRVRPDILVTQQGIDPHFTDPLTDLQLSTHAREHVVSWFASTPYPWVAMGGGGYDLDAVRRTWSMEYLIMLGAPVPESLHDDDPPVLGGRARTAVDAATDQATHEALAAAFR